jgi:L-lactate dehydrogenase complex protein LldG
MTRMEIVKTFTENAEKAGAEVFHAACAEDLNKVLAEILGPEGAIYQAKNTNRDMSIVLPENRLTSNYGAADFCMEEVFGAVAETGSIISVSSDGKEIQANLLPGHHVAIVAEQNIFESLEQFFTSWGDNPPTNITLETGPSRTGDIELTLTTGVHGPERLSIIVV